jgi:hypothetical protein
MHCLVPFSAKRDQDCAASLQVVNIEILEATHTLSRAHFLGQPRTPQRPASTGSSKAKKKVSPIV